MKNVESILKSLSRNYNERIIDRTLWLAIFALLACGFVMVYSASFIQAQELYKDGYHFFKRHVIFTAIGLIAFFIGWWFPAKKFERFSILFLILAVIGLIATFIPGIAHRAGGANRWIHIFGFSFQPAEFAKFAVIVWVARQITRKVEFQDNFRSGFLTYFLAILPIYFLLLIQPDFGTTVLLLCTSIFMMIAGGVCLRYLFSAAAFLIPIASLLILTSPYRRARLLAFIDPWSDPAHKGFQIIQSWLAFYSGKWLGVGVGNSHEKLFYLPKAHNDFIFAVIGEEWGLFGVVFLVSLFLLIVWRGLTAASRLTDAFQRSLAVGISCLIGLQAFFNMGVVLGLLPTKGLPLPLISYGGSSLVITLFLLGILVQLSEIK